MSRSLTRATAVMTAGTVLSRITGLLRYAAIFAALGVVASGRLTDAYNIGNTAPNIIYELVLGGVLTSVFVPIFVELLEKEGRDRAWEVASAILNLSVVVLVAFTTIGIVAAPWIARFYASRFGGQTQLEYEHALTLLLRLFIPQIIFYGIYAVTSGLLNAHKRFGAPMYTPVLNNLAVIAVFVAFYVAYGHVSSLHSATEGQLVFIGAGTTLGVVLQGLGNVPFMRGLGKYRWTLSISHPSVKKLARLSVFVIGYVVANQVGYVVVQYLAEKQVGGYSAYVAAFTFYMLPHGLFAVSVITALLPGMSGHATNERWDDYRRQLSIGIRATFLLILPAAIGYFALGTSVVRLLLQHGVMHEQDTELVASTLRYFVIGLVAFSLFQLLLRAYYALQDTKTPFVVNCAAVGLNIVADVVLFHYLKVEGLALGHAIAYTFGVVVLAVLLARRVGGIDGAHVVRSATRIAISATGMGVVVWVTAHLLGSAVGTGGLIPDATLVVVPVVVGVAAYVGLAILLGVEELSFVRGVVTRRFAR